MTEPDHLGPSGRIARTFQDLKLTPLLALLGILAGIIVVIVTPKEEEPQIEVTMADIRVPFPGASAREVESLIATPGEQILDEIKGVEHIYSTSRQGQAIITVQFEVGVPRQEALVRLYNKVDSNKDWFPQDLGAGEPVVKPKGIDDVPVMTLTLYDPEGRQTGEDLTRLAHTLEAELKRIAGTRDIYTVGGIPDRVDVHVDPARLAGYDLTLAEVREALQAANASGRETRIVRDRLSVPLQAGTPLSDQEALRTLVVARKGGSAIHLEDIATIQRGNTVPDASVLMGFGPAGSGEPGEIHTAVTLAIAKKAGENAIDITRAVKDRLALLKGQLIPDNTRIVTTRNYGETASDKARKLISDLVMATAAVMLLVLAAMGVRQAAVVGLSVLLTLLLTLVFSWAWGFTLNRVSLFALIFAIGILVDDAIVIVENVNRRIRNSSEPAKQVIPRAVDEVGTPTIMASLTIMAALLPMAFVTGLMGPYMSPIPINASAGMVFSQLVAFILTPWLALRLVKPRDKVASGDGNGSEAQGGNRHLHRFFRAIMTPFLGYRRGNRRLLAMGMILLTLGAASLPVWKMVVLKMLPFDDKSELQVVVDMPEDTPMEETQRVLTEMGRFLEDHRDVANWQAYAGTASPINFNGLVRQYYLRSAPYQGDLQVNLRDEGRERQSHEIALALREPLTRIGERYGASVKIVEVPPGPPVQSPVVAQVYGPTPESRAEQARELASRMEETEGLVDIDTSVEAPTTAWRILVDRKRAATLGVSQAQVVDALETLLGNRNVAYLRDPNAKYAVPIRVLLEEGDRAQASTLLSTTIRNRAGESVQLNQVARIERSQWPGLIHHKDLLPVTYVTADMAGAIDSPLYGMFDLASQLADDEKAPVQHYISAPEWPSASAVKWDGEWQVTYETFRDMGIAYMVGIVAIYLLLVAQFGSYGLPLIVMAPIPLTLIGIMPGHALLGMEFTATSMIGMIALAGIIVRNSILLIVFIRDLLREGYSLDEAVVWASAVRIKPILLTAISAILGAAFILTDPIFNGLAISLIFGLAVSTLLTVLVVPLAYYAFIGQRGAD
jgi:multidrug efflux pump subunit AcrB